MPSQSKSARRYHRRKQASMKPQVLLPETERITREPPTLTGMQASPQSLACTPDSPSWRPTQADRDWSGAPRPKQRGPQPELEKEDGDMHSQWERTTRLEKPDSSAVYNVEHQAKARGGQPQRMYAWNNVGSTIASTVARTRASTRPKCSRNRNQHQSAAC